MVSAIVVAAGSSSRMGVDKLLLEFGGVPVVVRSIRALEQVEEIGEVVVVTREERLAQYRQLKETFALKKVTRIVAGGETRQQSVLEGVRAADPSAEYVAIHDGARPFVSLEEITRVLADAERFGAATLGVPVKDTVKVVSPDGMITATPDRSSLYLTQTPQVFRREVYLQGIEAARQSGLDFTDDCQLVEHAGHRVYMACGSYRNIKLTTEDDLAIANAFLRDNNR